MRKGKSIPKKKQTKSPYEYFLVSFRKEYRKTHAKVSYDEKEMRKAAKAQWEEMDTEVRAAAA